VASLLALLALVTLLIKSIVEWKAAEQTREFEIESVRSEEPVLMPNGAKAA
jgi:hypothetical protein